MNHSNEAPASSAPVLGILAGDGAVPVEAARRARALGNPAVVVHIGENPDPQLQQEAQSFVRIPIHDWGRAFQFLKGAGVNRIFLLGKVEKRVMFFSQGDATAQRALQGLSDWGNDSVLQAVVAQLQSLGIQVGAQSELLDHLVMEAGNLTTHEPRSEDDIALGFKVAQALAGLDVGQTVVVKDRAVLAVEAIEGTGPAVQRAGELGGAGATVVKISKPHQDPRFDVPVVGLGTLEAMLDAGAQTLALEAGKAFLLQREAVLARAEQAGVAIVGIDTAEGLGRRDDR